MCPSTEGVKTFLFLVFSLMNKEFLSSFQSFIIPLLSGVKKTSSNPSPAKVYTQIKTQDTK